MEQQAAILNGASPLAAPRQHAWTPAEEDRLFRLVRSENLSGRTTTATWERIADRLAAESGFPLRTGSSVRHRATKIGAYSRDRLTEAASPTVRPVERVQSSFAAPEVKAEVNRSLVAILRRVADELEHGA